MQRLRSIPLFLVCIAILPLRVVADERNEWIGYLDHTFGVSAVGGNEAPLWIWANQDARIPRDGSSAFTRLRLGREPDPEKTSDWMYGVDLTLRSNTDPAPRWTDSYAGLTWKKLQFILGRRSENVGLADPVLTSGPEVYSRNAPTIPKASISTRGYADLADWLGVNAGLAHGWLGDDQLVHDAYLHEKYLYLRFGSDWPDDGMNFYAGIHHVAVWGGDGQPSGFDDFLKIVRASKGGASATQSDQANALGDHRGTIEFALKAKGYDTDRYLYVQSMFEDSSGLRFWDPGDYLIGASVIFKDPDARIARLNVEYFNTRKSSGSQIFSDNYYTNGTYGGWVHEGWAIGHPFIPFNETASDIWNPQNRITALSGAALMRFSNLVNPLIRIAWIRNSGSFSAPLEGDTKTTTLACDLQNTTRINRKWSFTQQVSIETAADTEPKTGIVLSLTRSWR
ncbi:MAG: hypothetical protein A3K90_08955 [Pelodictyon luteolum]|uniref:Capsule assembly Wzi family protein n=1 Tax=Pelodictyon luteolum TaxID=1100 RepID=A0A165MB75_PELLU|nr:capsule assembly Wzi family protein [Pelodictyon luteolum]KZK75037.1 MAG: hypothetical protein A3K90_08955 [Pelodictyon luteolum]